MRWQCRHKEKTFRPETREVSTFWLMMFVLVYHYGRTSVLYTVCTYHM